MPTQLQLPEPIRLSSTTVIEATSELQSLMLGPMGILFHQIDSPVGIYQSRNHGTQTSLRFRTISISLHAVSRFQIALSFFVNEQTSFAEIARKRQLDEDVVRRILRHATTNHIFKEVENGTIVHPAASKALAQVPLWLEQACDDTWPATSRFIGAMVNWPASEEPSQTAFNVAFGTQNSHFDEIAKSPARVQ